MKMTRYLLIFAIIAQLAVIGCVVPKEAQKPPPEPPEIDVAPGDEIAAAREHIQNGIDFFQQSKETLSLDREKFLSRKADQAFKKALVCYHRALKTFPRETHWYINREIRSLMSILERFQDNKFIEHDYIREILVILGESPDGLTPEERARLNELKGKVVPPEDIGIIPGQKE